MSIVPRTVEEIEVKYNGDKDGQDEIFIFRPGWLETIPSWRGSTNKNSIIYGFTDLRKGTGWGGTYLYQNIYSVIMWSWI